MFCSPTSAKRCKFSHFRDLGGLKKHFKRGRIPSKCFKKTFYWLLIVFPSGWGMNLKKERKKNPILLLPQKHVVFVLHILPCWFGLTSRAMQRKTAVAVAENWNVVCFYKNPRPCRVLGSTFPRSFDRVTLLLPFNQVQVRMCSRRCYIGQGSGMQPSKRGLSEDSSWASLPFIELWLGPSFWSFRDQFKM